MRALSLAQQAGNSLLLAPLTQSLEDMALTSGNDAVLLEVLHAAHTLVQNGSIQNQGHHAWNIAMVWYRAKGGNSKRARTALHNAVELMPLVYSYCEFRRLPLSFPTLHTHAHTPRRSDRSRTVAGGILYICNLLQKLRCIMVQRAGRL